MELRHSLPAGCSIFCRVVIRLASRLDKKLLGHQYLWRHLQRMIHFFTSQMLQEFGVFVAILSTTLLPEPVHMFQYGEDEALRAS
jgi:hypothetical protein